MYRTDIFSTLAMIFSLADERGGEYHRELLYGLLPFWEDCEKQISKTQSSEFTWYFWRAWQPHWTILGIHEEKLQISALLQKLYLFPTFYLLLKLQKETQTTYKIHMPNCLHNWEIELQN